MGTRRVLFAIVVALVGLVGCSGGKDDTNPTLPPVSGSSAPSASVEISPRPTPTVSTPTPSAAGAVEAAHTTFDAINALVLAQDDSALAAVSLPYCLSCNQFRTAFLERKRAGYRFSGGQSTILGAIKLTAFSAVPPSATATAVIPVATAALQVTDRAGQPYTGSDPAGSAPAFAARTLTCSLRWLDNRWQVEFFAFS